MNATEVVGTIIEGLIGLVVVVGGFFIIDTKPDEVSAVIPLVIIVLTFYFVQRSNKSTMNGTITAMTNIADKQQQTSASTVAATTQAAATMRKIANEPPVKVDIAPNIPDGEMT